MAEFVEDEKYWKNFMSMEDTKEQPVYVLHYREDALGGVWIDRAYSNRDILKTELKLMRLLSEDDEATFDDYLDYDMCEEASDWLKEDTQIWLLNLNYDPEDFKD